MNSQPATCGEELERPNTQVRIVIIIVIIIADRIRISRNRKNRNSSSQISDINNAPWPLCLVSHRKLVCVHSETQIAQEKTKVTFHKYGETPTSKKLFLWECFA